MIKKSLELVLEVTEQELSHFSVKNFMSNGIPSMFVTNQQDPLGKCKVILNGHLDVTPAPQEFYHAKQSDGKIFGRGKYDMKAASAVMILLFQELAGKVNYPLGLQLVTDEEIGGYNGTKHQIEEGVKADFVLCGDASNFEIVNKAKGFYWLKVTAKGITAHGAYPWEGDNAILKMNHFLEKLEKLFPIPQQDSWTTTFNLVKVETTNTTFNEVPVDCTAWLDVRHTPEEKEVTLRKTESILPSDLTYETILNEPHAYTAGDNDFIKKLQQAAQKSINQTPNVTYHQGGSDARLYTHVESSSVEFGPKGGRLPDGNESVSIEGLEEYYHTLKEFLLSLHE